MPVFAIVIDLTALYALKRVKPSYKPISVFPAVHRDLSFIVDSSQTAKNMMNTARSSASKLLIDITVFDIFKGPSIGEGKTSIGLRLTFQSQERTLIEEEINQELHAIKESLISKHQAIMR
jgi:phenylalanyl-tRNA synthetase beta chain